MEKDNPEALHVPPQEAMYDFWGRDLLDGFPDEISCGGAEYAVYYQNDPGAEDDGVTLGVHIDQLPDVPEWLPEWGVPGHLAQRAECLLRTLPKDLRVFLQPISQKAAYFAELRHGLEPDGPLAQKLAEFVEAETGRFCAPSFFDMNRIPAELVIVSAGVRANIRLAKDAGIAAERHITVDDHMRTNLPDVYAAGDCASMGVSYALWTEAADMGRIAGINAAGGDAAYQALPRPLIFHGFGTALFAFGDTGRQANIAYEIGEMPGARYYSAGGKLVGAVLTGDIRRMEEVTNLILQA